MKWIFVILLFAALPAAAQKYPERRVVRAGNRAYEKGEWQAAEGLYKKALDKAPESREAAFNLGSALFKQEKWGEAAAAFSGVAEASQGAAAAQALYGAGTAQARERKLQEALETLKNAMRADPADQDAKFNYAYVKKLLEGQQGGGDNNDKNQDQQDKQEQQNQQQQGDQEQQGSQGENQQGQGNNQQEQQGQGNEQQDRQGSQGENQQGQGGMSREDAERMLEAMQAQEDQTQEKIDGQRRAATTVRSGKNW